METIHSDAEGLSPTAIKGPLEQEDAGDVVARFGEHVDVCNRDFKENIVKQAELLKLKE